MRDICIPRYKTTKMLFQTNKQKIHIEKNSQPLPELSLFCTLFMAYSSGKRRSQNRSFSLVYFFEIDIPSCASIKCRIYYGMIYTSIHDKVKKKIIKEALFLLSPDISFQINVSSPPHFVFKPHYS